ncbi:hypothetical protein Pcinc_010126 [Petrolisthes cinctipes]|uniref:Ig-like domain-containing protein n=1 Tax=Petrolisthes cinctipes TaxID=88211 RepID=A0AAE1G0Z8_PETCI|nr:hypothetical protein Pcinc_011426 [Petrolisthes cinctipes]KAK3885485.1 hypothetical protein Pcinc_010310 [Petrolisthes cinctipes]KAK3885669.1 hypothetical protein Pcinc_010126 [Petrolisthes cinctipes]
MLAGSVVGVSGWGNIDVGSDGRTLQVVRAGTHNPDDYTCTATNQAGVIDIPVTLNDLVPPVIAWKKSGVMGSVGVGEEVVWVKEGGHAALEFSTTSVAVVLWHTGSGVNNLISAASLYTRYLNIHCVTTPLQQHLDQDREGEQRRNNTGWYSISKDRTRLTLPRETRTEEGLYSCEITKQAGSTRRIFRVDALAQ